jgi:hypothetical protein
MLLKILDFIAIMDEPVQEELSYRCILTAFYWLPENQNVRNLNTHAVVDWIRLADRCISRANRADELGPSPRQSSS